MVVGRLICVNSGVGRNFLCSWKSVVKNARHKQLRDSYQDHRYISGLGYQNKIIPKYEFLFWHRQLRSLAGNVGHSIIASDMLKVGEPELAFLELERDIWGFYRTCYGEWIGSAVYALAYREGRVIVCRWNCTCKCAISLELFSKRAREECEQYLA